MPDIHIYLCRWVKAFWSSLGAGRLRVLMSPEWVQGTQNEHHFVYCLAAFYLLPGGGFLESICETLARVFTLGKCLAGNGTVGTEEKSVVSDGWAARSCQSLCPWLIYMCYSMQQKFQMLISSAIWDKEGNSGSIWERFRLCGGGKTCLRKISCT